MTSFIDRWPTTKVESILRKTNIQNCAGPMTGDDILDACYTGEIYISPFRRGNLTSIGYNLRASDIIISTKNGLPLKILTEGKKRYVVITPHDTVLIATYESVYVGEQIMGTFHSRVMVVSQGFGHISTTLDPMWKGPLLIAFSNPSDKKKKFIIEDNGEHSAFATLIFYRLNHAARIPHDNPPARTDVLSKFLQTPKGAKKFIVGRASAQYCQLVQKIEDSYNTYPNTLPTPNPAINKIRNILTEIRTQICDFNHVQEARLCVDLIQTVFEQNAVPDLNPIIVDLLEITARALQEFDPSSANAASGTMPDTDYECLFPPFLDAFLYQLRYEEQTQAWLATYKECCEIAQSDAISANWLRLVLGRPWHQLIPILVGIILLVAALVLLVYTRNNTSFWADKSHDSLWVPLIGFIFSLLTLLIQALSKSNNR